jgi:hypothetical protein
MLSISATRVSPDARVGSAVGSGVEALGVGVGWFSAVELGMMAMGASLGWGAEQAVRIASEASKPMNTIEPILFDISA